MYGAVLYGAAFFQFMPKQKSRLVRGTASSILGLGWLKMVQNIIGKSFLSIVVS